MNNMAILEKVAVGDISPEVATDRMLEADREAKQAKRPAWLPVWAWATAVGVACALLAVIGIRVER